MLWFRRWQHCTCCPWHVVCALIRHHCIGFPGHDVIVEPLRRQFLQICQFLHQTCGIPERPLWHGHGVVEVCWIAMLVANGHEDPNAFARFDMCIAMCDFMSIPFACLFRHIWRAFVMVFADVCCMPFQFCLRDTFVECWWIPACWQLALLPCSYRRYSPCVNLFFCCGNVLVERSKCCTCVVIVSFICVVWFRACNYVIVWCRFNIQVCFDFLILAVYIDVGSLCHKSGLCMYITWVVPNYGSLSYISQTGVVGPVCLFTRCC